MENTFQALNLSEDLVTALGKQDITAPMSVQSLVIPHALEGKDLIAQAHTGSGKTLAFVLPIFEKIDPSLKQSQAMILAPTHELVVQINDQIKLLAQNSGRAITTAIIMGGMDMEKQIKNLKNKPHVIVGSSGRILDLIKKKKLTSHTVKTVVIDEADNLLDKNQSEDVRAIIKTMQRDTQIMLFSATVNPNTVKVAEAFTKEPLLLNACEESMLNPAITHTYVVSERRKKFDALRKLLNTSGATKSLVFVNNIHEVEVVLNKLLYHKKLAGGLYGKQTKQQRQQVLANFRKGKINVLVSSDISARGLDIPDISHVFNLDLPPSSHDYLHRAGRTARGMRSGDAISIITQGEQRVAKEYEKQLNIKIAPVEKKEK
ncbi:MAG: DEAD/DEAH box helicase [Cellulosilyticaceae bacterium]